MSWRPIPQEIYLQISLWKPLGWYLPRKTISSNLAKISRPKTKIFWGISPKTPHLFWRYFVRGTLPTICEGHCLPNKLRMDMSSKQIPKETSTKEYLEKHAYQKKTKEKSLRTKNLKRKLSPKNCSNNFSTKNYLEKFYQGSSEETFPAKIKFEEQSLPKHMSQETFPYQTNWRNISTQNHLKRNLYQKEWRKHLHQKIQEKKHNKKHGKNRSWWNPMKQRVFIKFHQFRFLQFFMSKTTWFFWVVSSLEIVFGRVFFWMDFLGRDASSDIVW